MNDRTCRPGKERYALDHYILSYSVRDNDLHLLVIRVG